MPVKMVMARLVAMAVFTRRPSPKTIKGVIITVPPMPRRPAAIPMPTPARSARAGGILREPSASCGRARHGIGKNEEKSGESELHEGFRAYAVEHHPGQRRRRDHGGE